MISLANHGSNPAIDLNYFPSNSKSPAGYWWTSQSRGADRAWVVNRGGGTGAKPKDETLSAGGKFSFNARYVRGSTRGAQHHYVDNKDGAITDSDTGLMWVQTPEPGMSWDAATTYAKGLTVGGHSDWRLPDVKELATLIDFEILNSPDTTSGLPCIDRTFFPTAKAEFCWTSTKLHSPSPGKAWYVDFAGGNLRYDAFSHKYAVLAVRTAAPAASLPVGPNSYFHPEDAPTDQTAETHTGGEKADGGTAGNLHLIPRAIEEKLNLTDEQRKQIDDLSHQAREKLEKILTPEQINILKETRPPEREALPRSSN